jgi:hypothetical protein
MNALYFMTMDKAPFFTDLLQFQELECGICRQAMITGPFQFKPELFLFHEQGVAHPFHRECIFRWNISEKKDTCPVCRKVVAISAEIAKPIKKTLDNPPQGSRRDRKKFKENDTTAMQAAHGQKFEDLLAMAERGISPKIRGKLILAIMDMPSVLSSEKARVVKHLSSTGSIDTKMLDAAIALAACQSWEVPEFGDIYTHLEQVRSYIL